MHLAAGIVSSRSGIHELSGKDFAQQIQLGFDFILDCHKYKVSINYRLKPLKYPRSSGNELPPSRGTT